MHHYAQGIKHFFFNLDQYKADTDGLAYWYARGQYHFLHGIYIVLGIICNLDMIDRTWENVSVICKHCSILYEI